MMNEKNNTDCMNETASSSPKTNGPASSKPFFNTTPFGIKDILGKSGTQSEIPTNKSKNEGHKIPIKIETDSNPTNTSSTPKSQLNPLLALNPFLHSINQSNKHQTLFNQSPSRPHSPVSNPSMVRHLGREAIPYWMATAAALWKNQGEILRIYYKYY